MNIHRWLWIVAGILLLALVLVGCGAAATPSSQPATVVATQLVDGKATEPAPLPTASPAPAASESTQAIAPTPAPTSIAPAPSPTPLTESRVTELEWPPQMRLGDSDLIRLSLIPFNDRYEVVTEYRDHTTLTSTVPIPRPGGYDLSAVARLDATGFDYSPQDEIALGLPLNEPVTWRWTITPRSAGVHRVSVSLLLRWTPQTGNPNPARETQIYSKGLEVRVASFLGLTTAQAASAGLTGLFFGGVLSLPLAAYLLRPRAARWQAFAPNRTLVIEPHPDFSLQADETALLQTLFRKYARLVLEAEFRSGYSGARTVLARPLHADGRADAHTIAKMGERDSIQREYENYERFVKDTLPPMTARIQEPPVTPTPYPSPKVELHFGGGAQGRGRAALRYTFISEPGRTPISLREALLAHPDPALLEKLFSTFGPNWWMQRHPRTFRLAQEYDAMLPAHYVLEPVTEKVLRTLDGRSAPNTQRLEIGELVRLENWRIAERRADGQSLSLMGAAQPGQPPLRARWHSLTPPNGLTARVSATRASLLREYALGLDRFGLPDPLDKLPALLNETVSGTQSIIHGDLNLENVLVGPGGFVWLIDFAQTRDGHPLADFAHLAASLIAHVLAPQTPSPAKFLALLHANADPLLNALRGIAGCCLFNPAHFREYDLALFMACLGALKYTNLSAHQKHLLYLAAAYQTQMLQ